MNKKVALIIAVFVGICLIIAFVVTKSSKKDETDKEPVEIITGEATLQAQEGNYTLKITRVLEVEPDPKEANAPEAQSVAIVIYEYTNADIEHGLAIGNTHFKAYDSQGNELEQYPQKNLFEPSEVGQSGTFTASVAFVLNSTDNYLKIEYYKDISTNKADVAFEEKW